MKLFDLHGQRAVITGATRGLGQSMAIALAEAGADLVLLQRNTQNTETQEKVNQLGRECHLIECDLQDMGQVRLAIDHVVKQAGKIDILVNNAGIQRRSPAIDFSEKDWDDVIDINLKSIFLLCREAGKMMISNQYGKIINIASLVSFQGGITVPAYAAAKGGVAQLTKALSNEWAKFGINVNAIAPGYMATDLNEALLNDENRSRQILERIPAERWGNPDDMKGAVIFLASQASNYVNGHVLAVDGGWLGR
ncbi:2-dehydro-3-deoxy-D-gluconate 5-dehydrogenase KduD [Alkalihalobacillus oceani]|uniref:2-dehydro-3-deoxy-D-gluconate 5-dehydrogenase KduD n=1 Tax=Halalkalibacter oceani TaxID=1653776 RepID=A0A9X2DSB3_9BACI|nr:2-dehydro-3-deoxy-D-gluconate 5-dehydrogenase KduD [Halalkalibacter oceani]MCM3716124.1 2-dehydro-3-deoxy-D-gluconate 5-dehydrogenase KduD [Halalkalibacter oceani]